MEFTKIRRTNDETTLDWTSTKRGEVVSSHLTSPDAPLESFDAALQAFRTFFIDLLDLPEAWRADLVISGISLDVANGKRGLIVTGRRPIHKANGRTAVLNTPRMPEAGDEDSPNVAVLDMETAALIGTLCAEAARFVRGERAQRNLFDGATEEPAAEAPDGANGDAPTKPRRRRKKDYVEGVPVVNPDATEALTDSALRRLLLQVGRDVAIESINQWTSSQRDAVEKWARAVVHIEMTGKGKAPRVPAHVMLAALAGPPAAE